MTFEHKQLGVIEDKSAAISDAKLIMQFIYGGKAVFTLRSTETNSRYTYRVNEKVETGRPTVYFVGLLAGPDNESDYTYLGWIRNNQFGLTKKSFANGLTEQTPSIKAFAWAFTNFVKGVVPEKLEFWHAGRCARCGRALTVPQSIEDGFGPECITKVGMGMGNQPITGSQAPINGQGSLIQRAEQIQIAAIKARNDSFVARPAVNSVEPPDAEVNRMVNALANYAPEQFLMDGEIEASQARKFWFRRYKKTPLTPAELAEMEAQ